MAEHVDVDWEADLGFLAQRLTNRFMASRVKDRAFCLGLAIYSAPSHLIFATRE